MDGRTSISTEFNSSSYTFTFPSLLNMGEAHEKSHQNAQWESEGEKLVGTWWNVERFTFYFCLLDFLILKVEIIWKMKQFW